MYVRQWRHPAVQASTAVTHNAVVRYLLQHIFDEGSFLTGLLDGLGAAETDLATMYDYAYPCFPPSWNMFDRVFQVGGTLLLPFSMCEYSQ